MLPPVPWRCWRPDLSAATPSSASSTRRSRQSHPSPDDACRLVEAMTLKQTLEAFEALDSARASGRTVVELLAPYPAASITVEEVRSDKGKTDFVKIVIAGTQGHRRGGTARTLGIVGKLGGLGARPKRIGLVSDGDGAVAAVAIALKIARMQMEGDPLPGDAIISIDTTKGNRILNHRGFAISPTVKEGYILRVADDLVRIMETTTGRPAVTFPITMQDITPYGNNIYHINSILQPSIATDAPVVGVAISAETVVPGSATGASHEIDIAAAVKFAVEVAKEFGRATAEFYDAKEFARLNELYGSMHRLRHRAPLA